jgi:hypothetical protein
MIMLGIWSTILSQVLSLGILVGSQHEHLDMGPGLWMSSLDYFNIVVGTCTWDTATSTLWLTLIHGTQVYGGACWTTSTWWLALVHGTLVLLAYFNIVVNTHPWDFFVFVMLNIVVMGK